MVFLPQVTTRQCCRQLNTITLLLNIKRWKLLSQFFYILFSMKYFIIKYYKIIVVSIIGRWDLDIWCVFPSYELFLFIFYFIYLSIFFFYFFFSLNVFFIVAVIILAKAIFEIRVMSFLSFLYLIKVINNFWIKCKF